MTTASVSVFESLAYRRIKDQITKKLDQLLLDISGMDGVPEGEKRDAETKCFEMFQRATNEFVASRNSQ